MEGSRLHCSVLAMAGDNVTEEQKQNVNVILVPESVLLALSNSTNAVEDAGDASLITDDNQKAVSLLDSQSLISVPTASENNVEHFSRLQRSKTNEYQPPEQEREVVVLESNGEWLINADLSDTLNKTSHSYFLQSNVDGHSEKTALHVDQSNLPFERNGVDSTIVQQMTDAGSCDGTKTAEEKLKPYKCTVFNCYKKFHTEEELKKHCDKHDKEAKVHRCQFPGCPWSFSTPYKLRRHALSHERTKLFKCSYPDCNVSCSTKYNLKAHEQVHKCEEKSFCSECNISFSSKLKMLKHQRLKHEREAMFSCTHDGCDKKFHTIAARTTHLKTHQRMNLVCDFQGCGKEFRQPAAYREHYMSKHTQIRPFKCKHPNCTWKFTTNAKLKRHIITHTDIKSWTCPFEKCSARFYRKEHLKSHLKTHSSENEEKKKGSNDPDAPIELNVEGLSYFFCPYEDCRSLFTTLMGAKQHIQKIHLLTNKKQNKLEVAHPKAHDTVLETQDLTCTQSEVLPDPSGQSTSCNMESSGIPAGQNQPTNSILRTLMQAESGADIAATNETLNATATISTPLSSSQTIPVPKFTVACTSEQLNPSNQSNPRSSSSSTLGSSHFLLLETSAIDFPMISSSALQDGVGFANTSSSMFTTASSASAADQFLTFNDCVHTVDPNAVMAIKAPLQNVELLQNSPQSESSDEDKVEMSTTTTNKNDLFNTGGSARTDCNAYQKIKIRKQWNPMAVQEEKSQCSTGKKCQNYEAPIDSFILHEVEVLAPNQLEPKMPVNQHFEGSTINLSDLA